MKMTVRSLAALTVVLSACSDAPVQPTAARIPTVNVAVQAQATDRSIVEFDGPVRKDFRQTVASLGGSVDFVADGAGFAGVSGLSVNARATLRRSTGVAAVYDDVVVQLSVEGW